MRLLIALWVGSLLACHGPTIDGCVNSLRLICLGLLFFIPAEMVSSGLTGTGDTDAVFVIELLSSGFVLAWVWGAALVFELPLEFVWSAELMGALLTFGLASFWLRSGRWTRFRL